MINQVVFAFIREWIYDTLLEGGIAKGSEKDWDCLEQCLGSIKEEKKEEEENEEQDESNYEVFVALEWKLIQLIEGTVYLTAGNSSLSCND